MQLNTLREIEMFKWIQMKRQYKEGAMHNLQCLLT